MSEGIVRASGPLASLRPQDRRALMTGAVLLVVLLGYSRIAKPAWENLRTSRRELADQQALLGRERALVAAAPTFGQETQVFRSFMCLPVTRLT